MRREKRFKDRRAFGLSFEVKFMDAKCDKCENEFYNRYNGKNLCRRHFHSEQISAWIDIRNPIPSLLNG